MLTPEETRRVELVTAAALLVNAGIACRERLGVLADLQRMLEAEVGLIETARVLDDLDGAIAGMQELLS